MEDQGKRLLLAVAVAFAIMLGWTFLFPPEQAPKKPAPEGEPTGEVVEPDRVPGDGDRGPEAAEPGPGQIEPAKMRGEEQTIVLQSPEVRATFSSWGGALKSWQLLGDQFHVPGRESLQEDLVRLGDQGFYNFGLGFDSSSTYQIPADAGWKGEKVGDREVVYRWESSDLRVEKRFRIRPEDYVLEMDVNYELLKASEEQRLVMTLHSYQDPREVKEGGWTSLPREWKAACLVDDEVESWGGKAVKERKPEERGDLDWAGFVHSYFLAAMAPRVTEKTLVCRTRPVGAEPGGMAVDMVYPPTKLGEGESSQTGVVAYLGPKYLDKLEAIAGTAGFATKFEESVDLGFLGFLAGPLLWLLQAFHGLVGSWGIAIILLTIVVKLATLYWTHKSMKSMKAMAKLKPQLDKIREKHKDDRQKQQVETMNLFKAHGVNPLAGCLPMLLQMPIWFALYRALSVAAELYQAEFLWFHDLTAPDPFYILPVFMTLTMLLQSRLTPTTATGMQQKILMFGMPLMFGGFSLFFPAGLTLYISTNTVLTLLHHLYMRRDEIRVKARGAEEPAAATGKLEALAAGKGREARDEDAREGDGEEEAGEEVRAARGPSSGRGTGAGAGKGKGGRKGGKRSKRSSRSS
jgi:YidC/Oxa1 family membrane protein insertase